MGDEEGGRVTEGRERESIVRMKGTLKEEGNRLLGGSRSLTRQGSRGGGLE